MTTVLPSPSYAPSHGRPAGYGRARLWIGITAVGTVVTLATVALASGLPARIEAWVGSGLWATVLTLAMYAAAHAVVQLPFDLFGGYLLPVRHGRSRRGIVTFLRRLLRGAVVYATVLFVSLCALLAGGKVGGVWGVITAGATVSILLLWGRSAMARTLARMNFDDSSGKSTVVFLSSDDEGFTGGVLGVLRPRRIVLPAHWQSSLKPDQLSYAQLRRELAASSGIWWRGRVVALVFTLAGLGLSAVAVGSSRLGTAGGIIEMSLWFTLWSFVGLLTLPTLSRRGVAELDDHVRSAGISDTLAASTARALDAHQDDEPERPSLIETIFHPIPSISNREKSMAQRTVGAWDSARTALFLGLCGGGLLGRAVHCNCGRPALWVFLPTD